MNYRNTRCYHNLEKRQYEGIGEYQFPQIQPSKIDCEGVPLVGFNYALTEKNPEDKILHFFVDDYQFERVWNKPETYLGVLGRFKAVISPDFSICLDFPKAIQLYNNYRKQWCGAFWQENGITVIPSVRWGDDDSFDWCFDGVPRNSMICISTVGTTREKDVREKWIKGYYKALEVLEPSYILFYGKVYDFMDVPVPYTCAVNQNTLNRKLAREKLNAEMGLNEKI